MIEKLETFNGYDRVYYPSPMQMMEKINEIIDYINNHELLKMDSSLGHGTVWEK